AVLVGVKVGVVLFVIGAGIAFVDPKRWTGESVDQRVHPEELQIPKIVAKDVQEGTLTREDAQKRIATLNDRLAGVYGEKGLSDADRKKKAEKVIEVFYLETAKLPEDQAKERVRHLSAQVLALAKLERKKKELAGSPDADAELARFKDEIAASPLRKKEL